MTPEFIAWIKSGERKVLLAELGVRVGSTEMTRYLSTTGYVTGSGDTPANTTYLPRIVEGFEFTRNLSIEGSGSTSFGDIQLDNTDGALDGWLTDVWAKRSVKLFLGAPGWARSAFVQIFEGVASDISPSSRTTLSLLLRDPLALLENPISTATLGGTGDNADTPLPLALGECFNIEPLLVSPTGLATYKVNSGAVEQIIEIRDNGHPVTTSKNAGAGEFTLQYQRWGQITCDVQGYKAGAEYRRDIGGLIEWLATTIGDGTKMTVDQIDAASVSAFRAAYPQPVGWWGSVNSRRMEVITSLADSVGATVTTSRMGKLQIVPLAFGASVREITPSDMEAGTLEPVMRPEILGKIKLKGCRNWTVQGKEGLAAILEPNQITTLTEEWILKSAENSTVMSVYKQDDVLDEEAQETLLVEEGDVQSEAQRRLNLWSVPRTVFRFSGWAELMTLELGQTVTIKHPRLGLAAGAPAIVTSLGENYVTGRVNVEVLV
jgi:hypothetical protein